MMDPQPISLRRAKSAPAPIAFNRSELNVILSVYGFFVGRGEWRDYAIGHFSDSACFSIFKRVSEAPLYQIEKRPHLARRQGAYAVVSANGLVLKRGHDLRSVMRIFDRQRLRLAHK